VLEQERGVGMCYYMSCRVDDKVSILFALLGFLSPAKRGALLTTSVLLFVLLGSVAGYVTARAAKMWGVSSWLTILMTGTFFPGTCFGIYFVINLIMWARGAANAIPFSWLVLLVGLWIVSLPLVFIGAVVGYKQPAIEHPLSVNELPRHIPPPQWFLHPFVTIAAAGALPFAAAFIEIYFILSSIWQQKFYYVFGFLAIVLGILLIVVAEVTIVLIYFQLCYEDYRIWWRSFFIGASPGLYLFGYSIIYFINKLSQASIWATLMYFGYMLLASYLFSMMTGTIGFFASFFFTRTIYGSIKVD